jgi:thiamine biosynthesis lipoprotein
MHIADPPRTPTSRRGFIALGIGALAVAVAPVLGRARARLWRRTLPVMGTLAEIAVEERDPRRAQAALDAAFAELVAVERAMSRFDDSSDVGRANLGAAAEAVPVSAPTAAVIGTALAWAEASDGAFDPGLARAAQLWDVTHRRVPPPARDVRRFAGRRLYRALDLDTWGGRPAVRLTDPDVAIDLGGIAKGYGADRAADALRALGIRRALVNVGGELYAIGNSPEGDPWRVGIQSPFEPGRMMGEMDLSDGAVATSGDYLQYFEYRGVRYHHLLNPMTAAPRMCHMHSITIVAATGMQADAASTALFGMPAAAAAGVLQAMAPGARVERRI